MSPPPTRHSSKASPAANEVISGTVNEDSWVHSTLLRLHAVQVLALTSTGKLSSAVEEK